MKLVDQIKRTAADFIVNPANIFAQQSRTDELDTAEKQNGQKSANVSCSRYNAEILQMEYGITQIYQREKQSERQHTFHPETIPSRKGL